MKTLGKVGTTSRGFELIEFNDEYEVKCSLQQSSLAKYTKPGISAVWFGPNEPNAKILIKGEGWKKYPLP